MIKKQTHTTVYVTDQERAKAFYTEKLGFEVRDDARMGSFRWLTVSPKTQPDMRIVLYGIQPGPWMTEENAAMLKKLVESGAIGVITAIIVAAVSAGFKVLAAIFVSNLPEAIGSASGLHAPPRKVIALWIAVAIICTLATVAGFALADNVSDEFQGAANGFAAGALLVMLIDSMIPDAQRKGGNAAGLVTVLGFAVAAALTGIG